MANNQPTADSPPHPTVWTALTSQCPLLNIMNRLDVYPNSMSDLFHDEVTLEFIQSVFSTIVTADHHTFQVLTKRPEQAMELADQLPWPSNLWMGTSVENADYLHRVNTLRQIPAQTRFLSLEPLIGAIPNIDLTNIDWVIAGGESGPRARKIEEEWVRSIRDQCEESGTPFFFKQWDGTNKKRSGRHFDGKTGDEFPPKLPTDDQTQYVS